MSAVIGNPLLLGPEGYQISRSVRLRSSASAYFNRTPAGAGTSNKTFTYSAWVKRGSLGSIQNLISSPNTGNSDSLRFSAADALEYNWQDTVVGQVTTTQVFRDPSAWYHIMFAMDTTQATASNRFKLYVNGVQVTAFSTANYPAQNTVVNNTAAVATKLGQYANSSTQNFDGYLTEINFIDGQALTPSSFGEYDADTGVWKPKKYVGTYGTNGFYLNFSDNTSTTTLGYDYSGNGNNWTANNISLTSGVTYDSMTDVPTLTSETAGNYAVLSPIDKYSSTIGTSEANLKLISTSGGSFQQLRNTIGMTSGKYYMEWVIVSLGAAGRTGASLIRYDSTLAGASTSTTTSWCYSSTGDAYANNVTTSLSTGAITTGTDVVMYAFDADTGKFWMGKNGTWANSGDPATGANPIYSGLTNGPYFFGGWNYNTSDVVAFNFGQRPFAYTPPTGFKALNTFNLPDSTIVDGSQYFDATTYTGTGATQSIVNSGGMQPDFVWTKARSSAIAGLMFDSVRGATKYLQTNSTAAEGTGSDSLTAFASNGFTVGADTSTTGVNQNTTTYVGWQWQAGQGTTSSNTAGSITSTVSVNATAGFSIVTYTGTGSNATVGHGLGVAPSMVIVKKRNTTGGFWITYHQSIGNTTAVALNDTSASYTPSTAYWNNTSPTSSVFTIGNGSGVNTLNDTYVAYCFAAVAGYSAFGSYTGNGSTDGPFVFTNFRPRFIMVKRTDTTGNWCLFDSSRLGYNGPSASKELYPNLSNAEGTSNGPDQLSNGFKFRDSYADVNASGGTYVYAAFCESPFKFALAR